MMTSENQFSEVITTEAQLREIVGYPNRMIANLPIAALDDVCRDYIAKSPFLLIASSDARGNVDVSPKGDPPGFVHVLNDTTLLIPHRPGNRRADTFMNILQNPKVGLLFLIPGKRETLRISGQATLVRDADLRQQMAVRDKVPELLVAVQVEEAFFHCPKCMMRSELWDADVSRELENLSFLAQVVVQQGQVDKTVEEIQAMLYDDAETHLY